MEGDKKQFNLDHFSAAIFREINNEDTSPLSQHWHIIQRLE